MPHTIGRDTMHFILFCLEAIESNGRDLGLNLAKLLLNSDIESQMLRLLHK